MTLNSATELALVVSAVFAAGCTSSSADPRPTGGGKSGPRVTVYAVARVNERTETKDGVTYHLVAIAYDHRLEIRLATTGNVWLVNRRQDSQTIGPLLTDFVFKDEIPGHLRLMWVKLPEQGQLELHYGVVHFEKSIDDPEELRWRMLAGGYLPFTIDVAQLPVVKAESAAELAREMAKLMPEKDKKGP